MEFDSKIKVYEPDDAGPVFRPYVRIKIEQLNMSLKCITEKEIDLEIDCLLKEVERLRKEAKKKLKLAKSRHDEIINSKEGIDK